jgi:hypothetical protein
MNKRNKNAKPRETRSTNIKKQKAIKWLKTNSKADEHQ